MSDEEEEEEGKKVQESTDEMAVEKQHISCFAVVAFTYLLMTLIKCGK